jgi:hypothetical protein
MSNAVFPSIPGLGFSCVKSPEFSSIVQTGPALHTVRVAQAQNPIWHWQLLYQWMWNDPSRLVPPVKYTDLQTMMGFFLARQGRFDDFLFCDPDDNYSGPAMTPGTPPTPNLDCELAVVTDGAGNYYSPIQRNFAGMFQEDVTDLNAGVAPLVVYANGVLVSSTSYTVAGPGLAVPGGSYSGLYIEWGTEAPAAPVTAQFGFYFRAVFETDKLDFEKFMSFLWTFGGENSQKSDVLKLMSSRVGLV